MYDVLSSFLKKPALYEKSTEKFWNDPHISKGMLEAHLDPNTDAASRKPEFVSRSAKWISSLLPGGARLLDIGCGPGLYTKRLSGLGLSVTGLDFSERSVAYARDHDPEGEYVLMNYLQMDYENAFDIITLIWCDYGALIPEDRHRLLDRVNKALKPGGLFLIDVFTPEWNSGRSETTSWEVCESGGFWSAGPHILLNAEYYYGPNIGLNRTVVIGDDTVRCYNIWNTCFTVRSLSDEVTPHGFSSVDHYADVCGEPHTDASKTICAIFKKNA